MDRHVKIEGVCVGMSKADAWDILKNKGYTCSTSCITSKETVSFAGASVFVMFSFDSLFKIQRILIVWDKRKETNEKINSLEAAFAVFSSYFENKIPMKDSVNLGFSKRRVYLDLYNKITIFKQDSRDEGSPKYECVRVDIEDFVNVIDDKDKDKVIYARNSYIQRISNLTFGNNEGVSSINLSIKKKSISNALKIIALVAGLVFTYIVVSSYRYETFKDNHKYMRYDKWKQVYEKYDQSSKRWVRDY